MRRAEDADLEVVELLRSATPDPAHEPLPDLVRRTIEHVRLWIVLGDLVRLATLEAVWTRYGWSDETRPIDTSKAGSKMHNPTKSVTIRDEEEPR